MSITAVKRSLLDQPQRKRTRAQRTRRRLAAEANGLLFVMPTEPQLLRLAGYKALTGIQRCIVRFLLAYLQGSDTIWISRAVIAEEIGCSLRTVVTALPEIAAIGIIEIHPEEHPETGRTDCNKYQLGWNSGFLFDRVERDTEKTAPLDPKGSSFLTPFGRQKNIEAHEVLGTHERGEPARPDAAPASETRRPPREAVRRSVSSAAASSEQDRFAAHPSLGREAVLLRHGVVAAIEKEGRLVRSEDGGHLYLVGRALLESAPEWIPAFEACATSCARVRGWSPDAIGAVVRQTLVDWMDDCNASLPLPLRSYSRPEQQRIEHRYRRPANWRAWSSPSADVETEKRSATVPDADTSAPEPQSIRRIETDGAAAPGMVSTPLQGEPADQQRQDAGALRASFAPERIPLKAAVGDAASSLTASSMEGVAALVSGLVNGFGYPAPRRQQRTPEENRGTMEAVSYREKHGCYPVGFEQWYQKQGSARTKEP